MVSRSTLLLLRLTVLDKLPPRATLSARAVLQCAVLLTGKVMEVGAGSGRLKIRSPVVELPLASSQCFEPRQPV